MKSENHFLIAVVLGASLVCAVHLGTKNIRDASLAKAGLVECPNPLNKESTYWTKPSECKTN